MVELGSLNVLCLFQKIYILQKSIIPPCVLPFDKNWFEVAQLSQFFSQALTVVKNQSSSFHILNGDSLPPPPNRTLFLVQHKCVAAFWCTQACIWPNVCFPPQALVINSAPPPPLELEDYSNNPLSRVTRKGSDAAERRDLKMGREKNRGGQRHSYRCIIHQELDCQVLSPPLSVDCFLPESTC